MSSCLRTNWLSLCFIAYWIICDCCTGIGRRSWPCGEFSSCLEMMDFGGPQRITRGAMQYDWGGGLWPPSLHVNKGPVPSSFCRAVLIPLVKNKNGNLADVDNYRAIAIANAVSKLLQVLMKRNLWMRLTNINLALGKESRLWLVLMCSNRLLSIIDSVVVTYFVALLSSVIKRLIMSTTVDYWLLFCKLLDYNKSNACVLSVR